MQISVHLTFSITAINPEVERWWAEWCLAEMPPGTRLTATLPGNAVTVFVSLSYASSYSLSEARRLMAQWMVLCFDFGCRRQQKRHAAAPPPTAGGAEENGKKQAETGGSG